MLTLICGSALIPARTQLTRFPVPDDVLYVVPDILTATALAREIHGRQPGVACATQIVDAASLSALLTAGLLVPEHKSVPRSIGAALVRNIIDKDPGTFDYIVGKNSVPRMSQGVLDRILRAIESTMKAVSVDEDSALLSARGRQLKILSERFEQRLTDGGYRTEQVVLKEAVSQHTQSDWNRHFPHVRRVIFLDFVDHYDLLYLLVHSAALHIENCDVLLDFDPEGEASPAMDAAYQRFYDMAEKAILSVEELSPEIKLTGTGASNSKAAVITVTTVSEEINAAAAVIRKLLDDAPDDEQPAITVALPNWHDYAPALEKAFEEFNIEAVWQESSSVVMGGEWLLLDCIRLCTGLSVTGSSVSALFRAPGFTCLVPEYNTVDVREAASRLDYVLTGTGQLKGWKSIISTVQGELKRTQAERKRQNQWTDEEAATDQRLVQLLKQTEQVLKSYNRKTAVAEWGRDTLSLLARFAATVKCELTGLGRARHQELKRAVRQVCRFGDLLSVEPVTFSYFFTLMKAVIYPARVDNTTQLQWRPVTVCSPSVSARLRSDCCLMLGCNDGSFPQFARPDASLLGYNFHSDQVTKRARQRLELERILRNHSRVLLWMPAKVGTEDLLPSQLIEELLAAGHAEELAAEALLGAMKAAGGGRGLRHQHELVQSLKGLVLTDSELRRFAQRGTLQFNIAANISVMSSRSQASLAGFDGIIQDPQLKTWLATWADRHIYSVSQLDSVVGCSFRFFVDRMLHLEELEEADDLLPAHLFGSFTHNVLARFYRKWVADGRGIPRPQDEALARERLVAAFHEEHIIFPDLSEFARDLLNLKLFGELGPEGFSETSRSLAEISDSGVFGQFLQLEMQRGGDPATDFLKPANFEVGFGMGRLEEDDPLTVSDHLELDIGEGESIKLRGRIDRIDFSPTGVFAVTDYKTGHIPEKKEILGGYRTQLPVYMLVGKNLLAGKFQNPEPAGGLYYSLRKGKNAKVSGVFFRSRYQEQAGVQGRSCLKDEDFDATLKKVKRLMRHSIRAVKLGYLTTTQHDPQIVCRFCSYEGFCYRDVERTKKFWQAMDEAEDEVADASR